MSFIIYYLKSSILYIYQLFIKRLTIVRKNFPLRKFYMKTIANFGILNIGRLMIMFMLNRNVPSIVRDAYKATVAKRSATCASPFDCMAKVVAFVLKHQRAVASLYHFRCDWNIKINSFYSYILKFKNVMKHFQRTTATLAAKTNRKILIFGKMHLAGSGDSFRGFIGRRLPRCGKDAASIPWCIFLCSFVCIRSLY